MAQLRDPVALKNLTAAAFVENYELPETNCLVALRTTKDMPFRYPMQTAYGGNPSPGGGGTRYPLKAPSEGSGFLIKLARKYFPLGVKRVLRQVKAAIRL